MPKDLNSIQDLISSVWGTTHHDNRHHAIARTHLLRLLAKHRPTNNAGALWVSARGLLLEAEKLRSSIVKNAPADVIEQHKNNLRRIWQYNERDTSDDLAGLYIRDKLHFVDEHGIPWVWLVDNLQRLWFSQFLSAAFQQPYQPLIATYEPDAQIEFNFKSQPGESLHNALKRLKRQTKAFVEEQTKNNLPNGYRTDREVVEKYTTWFFRCKIEGVSPAQIADENHYADDTFVRDCIAKVERWLQLGF